MRKTQKCNREKEGEIKKKKKKEQNSRKARFDQSKDVISKSALIMTYKARAKAKINENACDKAESAY